MRMIPSPLRGSILLLAMLAVAPAHAQVQERKLFDRIMRPDTTLESSEARKSFSGGGSFAGKSFSTRDHYSPRSFPMRTYATNPNREGSRNMTQALRLFDLRHQC